VLVADSQSSESEDPTPARHAPVSR
jgi:hypothetical protein